MTPAFVQQSIEIDAPAQRVWDVLTIPAQTNYWVPEFGISGEIDSEWSLGSPVVWKDADGTVRVKGNVTDVEARKKLRFTVQDVQTTEAMEFGPEDGITLTIEDVDDDTVKLSVHHGDFSKMDNYLEAFEATGAIWNKVLPIIKEQAEAEAILDGEIR